MNKQIDTDLEGLKKIQSGINKLADVVKSTLGPGGTTVLIEKSGLPIVTKDGVTVCREITLDDPLENMGAAIVREAANKTVIGAGDGTSTSTLLAQSIFNAGFKNLAAGAARMELKRGIDLGVRAVVNELRNLSNPVRDGDLLKVATISANGDKVIGDLINQAITKVGRDGIVSVEDTKNLESYVTVVDGVRFDRGWLSGYFAADNLRQEWDYKDCEVLIYEGALSSYKEIFPFFDKIRKTTQKPLLVVANDVAGECLSSMANNHVRGIMFSCAVQSMDMNDKRNEHLKDLAALTGATIISKENGISLNTAEVDVLGAAERIRVSQHTTTILGGKGGDKIKARIATIEEEIRASPTEQALVALEHRKSRLTSGMAVIFVGGSSDIEIREKKDRIDDSLQATKAALDEGVVIGGGIAYLTVLRNISWPQGENPDQQLGIKIVASAIEEPFRAIVHNVGQNPEVVLTKIKQSTDKGYGFNAKTLEYCDLVEAGIIDPCKVSRVALENAASVAGMLLTTNYIISNIKPKQS